MAQTLDNLSYTWNNSGTTFTGIKYNVTDTASASGSLLMDLQVGGVSKIKARKDGLLIATSTTGNYSAYFRSNGFDNSAEIGRYQESTGNYIPGIWVGSNGTKIPSALPLQWGSSPDWQQVGIELWQDSTNVLAQRRGVNAQTFRLYNTYTDASNYERGFVRWNTNVLEIGAEAGGTGTQRQLSFPLGTVTASTPLSITQTWNATATTYTGILSNITDTASAAGSLLIDLQVGGSSTANITKTGTLALQNRLGAGSYQVGIGTYSYQGMALYSNGVLSPSAIVRDAGFLLRSGSAYGWGSNATYPETSPDLFLYRDQANTLAQRNGTNAQTFRLYNTYTDASNFERVSLSWSGNTAKLAAEAGGTGTARDLVVKAAAYQLSANSIVTDSTTARTLSATDNGKVIYFTNAAAIAVTAPTGLGTAFSCQIVQGGAGQITVAAGTSATVNAFGGLVKTGGQYSSLNVIAPVADSFVVLGGLA